jgi:hypothetical protein
MTTLSAILAMLTIPLGLLRTCHVGWLLSLPVLATIAFIVGIGVTDIVLKMFQARAT